MVSRLVQLLPVCARRWARWSRWTLCTSDDDDAEAVGNDESAKVQMDNLAQLRWAALKSVVCVLKAASSCVYFFFGKIILCNSQNCGRTTVTAIFCLKVLAKVCKRSVHSRFKLANRPPFFATDSGNVWQPVSSCSDLFDAWTLRIAVTTFCW